MHCRSSFSATGVCVNVLSPVHAKYSLAWQSSLWNTRAHTNMFQVFFLQWLMGSASVQCTINSQSALMAELTVHISCPLKTSPDQHPIWPQLELLLSVTPALKRLVKCKMLDLNRWLLLAVKPYWKRGCIILRFRAQYSIRCELLRWKGNHVTLFDWLVTSLYSLCLLWIVADTIQRSIV